MDVKDINRVDSESGVIATLIQHPNLYYVAEQLLPEHFTQKDNKLVYLAISMIVKQNMGTVDPYNIMQILSSSPATRQYAEELSIDKLQELVSLSPAIARTSAEEYKLLAKNVMDAAFRRDTYTKLRECLKLCADFKEENVEQRIYNMIDDVMVQYSTKNEIPQFKDVIDKCWEEIKSRQGTGYAGIPFISDALNEYATIEKGELVIFAAEAKQGKSMWLLNEAVDLLKRGKSVLYLDSELSDMLFTKRILSHLSGVEYRRLATGNYNEMEADEIERQREWLKTQQFTHLYIPMFDIQSIYTAVKKVYHMQGGLDVLIVDYFKSANSDGDAFASYQELGRYTDLVKNTLAGDMGIAAIGAAQATSTGKLADSAKIARNASTICLIQDKTEEEIQADGPECGNKKLRVVFNRNGAQMSSGEYIDLQFNGDKVLYTEAKQHIPVTPF